MFDIQIENPQMVERFVLAPEILHRETTNWLVDMSMWIKEDLKRRVPVKTGTLKNSIRYDLKQSMAGGEATFHSVWYGAVLDEGANPFTIQAQSGKPMVFNRGSDKVFAMTVKHPGIKARNFTLETLDVAEPEADRHADEIATRIFRAVIG